MNVGYVHTLETPDNAVDRGTLRVSVIDRDTNQPVQNARVEVSYTADPESGRRVMRHSACRLSMCFQGN